MVLLCTGSGRKERTVFLTSINLPMRVDAEEIKDSMAQDTMTGGMLVDGKRSTGNTPIGRYPQDQSWMNCHTLQCSDR